MSWPHIIAARSAGAGLDPAARHVLLVVSTYANDHGRAWVSAGTLAADTGYHERTVRRLIARLEQSTDICVIPRKGRTSLLELRALAPGVPRTLGKPTPGARARRITKEPDIETARAQPQTAPPVDIYAGQPDWTAERLERERREEEQGHQLNIWEV